MTQDQLLRRNQLIGARLEQMAAFAGQQLGGRLLLADARLRAVFRAQERLLNAIESLIEPTVPQQSA